MNQRFKLRMTDLRLCVVWLVLMLTVFAVFLWCLEAMVMHRLERAGFAPIVVPAQEHWV